MDPAASTVLHALLLALAAALFVAVALAARRGARLRVARGELLGAHLGLGLAVSAAALALFVDVAAGVVHPGRMARLDARVHDAVYAAATPRSVGFFRAMTWLGSPHVLVIAGLVVAVGLAIRRKRVWLVGWSTAIAGQVLLSIELKHVFHRARPLERYARAIGWSFPSGHSMGAVVFYGMGAYLLAHGVRGPRERAALAAGAALVALLVGASRVFLGVHWFFDVIGGYCAGAVWLAACVVALEVVRRRTGRPPERAPQDLAAPA